MGHSRTQATGGIRKVDDHTLTILWRDGVQHDISLRDLRLDPNADVTEFPAGSDATDGTAVGADLSALRDFPPIAKPATP